MIFQMFGEVKNPLGADGLNTGYGGLGSDTGPIYLISNIVKFITIAAGLWAFINIILAGIEFISATGDPEKTANAWKKIYMSLIGLVVVVAALSITAIVSQILFGSATAILNPVIYGPGEINE